MSESSSADGIELGASSEEGAGGGVVAGQGERLEAGSYEVLRRRLETAAAGLRGKLNELNEQRRAVFGGIETSLLGTLHLGTDYNCVPRDLVHLGRDRFLFGVNAQFGLKDEMGLSDVFQAFELVRDGSAGAAEAGAAAGGKGMPSLLPVGLEEFLGEAEFLRDFADLYRFYRETRFAKFHWNGVHLFMVFRVGKAVEDVKTFRFRAPGDGSLKYEGNRFDHEYVYPAQHSFEWKRVDASMSRRGEHPHYSIDDVLFVETVGGDLTLKVEDNTRSGSGIYEEPVNDPDQALEDAEISYARMGPLILLSVRPYREERTRFLLFHEKTKEVHRIDAIGDSCIRLPQDHGVIFATGVALMNGEVRLFDHEIKGLRFEREIHASNGEDVLFAFYHREGGDYVLLHYNVVDQSVPPPQHCHGYSLFADGTELLFRSEDRPSKLHALQLWQTPFLAEQEQAQQLAEADHPLAKIGNNALVRGLAQLQEILVLAGRDDQFEGLYLDLARRSRALIQGTWWIDEETTGLRLPLGELAKAAEGAVAEFDKVQQLRQAAGDRLRGVREGVERSLREAELTRPDDILGFVALLKDLRAQRGEVISLREVRYIDLAAVDGLEEDLVEGIEGTSEATAGFLAQESALDPYSERIDACEAQLPEVNGSRRADELGEEIDETAAGLELLTEITATLPLDDPQRATELIERVSGLYARLNQIRAQLARQRRELTTVEDQAEFTAQLSLLTQAATNALERAGDLAGVDLQLTRLLAQLEELEGRFAESDGFLDQLATKREEIYDSFEGRKVALLEARNRRAERLFASAERILDSATRRIESFAQPAEIHAWFASDVLIDKLRATIAELDGLGDSVKAQQLEGRLKGLRDEAIRGLRDRQDLYSEGGETIALGEYKFRVHQNEIELTIIPRTNRQSQDTELNLHITGSSFYQRITDPALTDFEDCWGQSLPSETGTVARAETLAWQFLGVDEGRENWDLGVLQPAVQKLAQGFPGFGYARGVHDVDAARMLAVLGPLRGDLGLGALAPMARALAHLFWCFATAGERELRVVRSLRYAREATRAFPERKGSVAALRAEVLAELRGFVGLEGGERDSGDFGFLGLYGVPALEDFVEGATDYLLATQWEGRAAMLALPAREFLDGLNRALGSGGRLDLLEGQLGALDGRDLAGRLRLILTWLERALPEGDLAENAAGTEGRLTAGMRFGVEAAAAWLLLRAEEKISELPMEDSVALRFEVVDLLSDHSTIVEGKVISDFPAWAGRLREMEQVAMPRFAAFAAAKHELLLRERGRLRLQELTPQVMGGFVRNRLIDEVYLPLIGANFARQLGAVGEGERAERMGLLLLISPPGYGKTTLMEYVAARLGLAFVKINGPALGHEVTSLDPSQAPDAGARRELERLNLGLMMGDNVLIYLDDVQHTNPEFLQKFISLTDAQRKIEGVWDGEPVTHDLRGRRVAVVMAGNPYTESGGKFRIPDMLANRADSWNLGDVASGHREAFVDSYIENALSSNPVLRVLTTRPRGDTQALLKVAKGASREEVELETSYAPAEEADILAVFRHLLVVREVILKVNQTYIQSAAQEDKYRTEPTFLLQGSYRNMARIAGKILPLLSDEERTQILEDHYRAEAQSLAASSEASLLKLRTMLGWATAEETARWEQILADYRRTKMMGGGDDDPVTRVVSRLGALQEGLGTIGEELAQARAASGLPTVLSDPSFEQLERIIGRLRTVPVEVNLHLLHQGEQVTNIQQVTNHSMEDSDEGGGANTASPGT